MRPIKFRAFNKERKHMSYNIEESDIWYKVLRGEDERYGELMQFTGLLDKNGKEIYEGDVLKLDNETRKSYDRVGGDGSGVRELQAVGFYNGGYMTCRKPLGKIREDFDTYLWIISQTSEIIGNIYENPELLTK